MDPFSFVLAAAVGWYIVSLWAKRNYDEIRLTDLENSTLDGIYTNAAVEAIRSQGQGQADYIGSPDFQPVNDTIDSTLEYVKYKKVDIEGRKKRLYTNQLEGKTDFHYVSIGDAVPSVVAYQKTYGATLPGSNIPGAMQGV